MNCTRSKCSSCLTGVTDSTGPAGPHSALTWNTRADMGYKATLLSRNNFQTWPKFTDFGDSCNLLNGTMGKACCCGMPEKGDMIRPIGLQKVKNNK